MIKRFILQLVAGALGKAWDTPWMEHAPWAGDPIMRRRVDGKWVMRPMTAEEREEYLARWAW